MRAAERSHQSESGPLFFLFLLLLVFSPISAEAVTAAGVDVKGLCSIGEDEFLNMFCTKKGSDVTEEGIRDGIKRAFLKGIFDYIDVDVPDGENPIVKITVRERDFIRKVRVSGNSALSAKLIRTLFILKEDNAMRYDLVDNAVNDLREKIAKYGYPDSSIGLETEKTGRPCRIDVHLRVDTGVPLFIKNIKINIVPPYPAEAKGFSGELKLSIGDVYDQHELENDLKKIKEYFKKNGYYRPVVGPYTFKEGDLEIAINPGKRMTIAIQGNSSVSERNLLKEAPFFEIEEFNDAIVEEAVARMASLYHKKGYPFIQIAPVVNEDDQNIRISFFVYEGEKIKVGSVSVKGITIPQDRLEAALSLKKGQVYNPDLIETDKDSIKEFYGALGYLDAVVKDIKAAVDKGNKTARVTIEIDEGQKTEVSSVDITGVGEELRNKLLALVNIKAGAPYNEVDISDARFRILEYFDNNGYPGSEVLVTREMENHRVSLVFKVAEGEKELFGKTIVTGNLKTKYRVIRREQAYKEGQPYSFRSLSEERQKLYRLGLFTDVEITPVDGMDHKKDILIRVDEGDAGAFDFGFGYADYEKFRGFAEVSYRNLGGMNRVGLLRAEVSSLENRFILQYNEPWFLGVPLPFRAFLLYENRTELNLDNGETLYKLTRYGATAGVEKKLSGSTKAELYYVFSLVNTRDVKPDVVLTKEDTGTLAISSIKPSIVYDTRDNPFDPSKGFFAGLSLKVASFVILSETNFVKLEAYGSNFHKLSKRFTIALSARSGVAFGYKNTDQLPIVERFFLGGRSTVRGYAQDTLGPKGADGNPTGGNAYLMGNLELRTSLGKGLGIVTFLDMGNVWLKLNELNPGDLKYTTGLGLRYSTPVGPLRVDYGFKLNRQPGESHGELHFSIGQAF